MPKIDPPDRPFPLGGTVWASGVVSLYVVSIGLLVIDWVVEVVGKVGLTVVAGVGTVGILVVEVVVLGLVVVLWLVIIVVDGGSVVAICKVSIKIKSKMILQKNKH